MTIRVVVAEPVAELLPDLADVFNRGEQVLGVYIPIILTPGDLTYYLVKRMRFEGGTYQIKTLADDAATWWFGSSQASSRMVFGHTLGQGVVEADIYIPRGVMRFDIILQNIPPGQNPCYITFSIWQNGELVYAANPEGWVFDTKPIPDEELAPLEDPRYSMPVWTVLPNWKDGTRERLSWLTDVMTSETGAEQRRSVRVHPRRSIEASFLRQGPARSRMDVFFAGVGSFPFLVPMWHEAVKMVEGISVGATGVFFSTNDTARREFRTGDLVLVSNGDPNDYDVLEVAEVEPGRFGWKNLPERAWPRGTRIYPLREAHMLESPQMQVRGDRVGIVQARFEMVKPDQRVAAWGGNRNGVPFFVFRPNRRSDVQVDYARTNFVLDNAAGLVQVTDLGMQSTSGVRLAFTLIGRAQVAAFRSMLAAARGRAVHFYISTFTHDIEPMGDIAGDGPYLYARPMGMVDTFAQPQPTRLMLMVEMADGGEPYYRNILNVVPVSEPGGPLESERLTLDEPLPPLARSDIQRISFVTPARLDQDSVELHHVTAGSRLVEVTLMIRHIYDRREGAPI